MSIQLFWIIFVTTLGGWVGLSCLIVNAVAYFMRYKARHRGA